MFYCFTLRIEDNINRFDTSIYVEHARNITANNYAYFLFELNVNSFLGTLKEFT